MIKPFNQDMFDFFAQNHGLTLTQSEMDDVTHFVLKTLSEQSNLPGAAMIAAERVRQIKDKHWTPEHDAAHVCGELVDAALSYIRSGINVGHPAMRNPPLEWPFEVCWWNPSPEKIRNFVKAAALLAAEIDRLKTTETK